MASISWKWSRNSLNSLLSILVALPMSSAVIMTAFENSSAGMRPIVLSDFLPDSIKKKQCGTLPVLGRCALVLKGMANVFGKDEVIGSIPIEGST